MTSLLHILPARPPEPATPPRHEDALRVSLVIPLHNEAGNVGPLVAGVRLAMQSEAWLHPYEIVLVNDGSDDGTAEVIRGLAQLFPEIRVISHPRSAGQSAAVHSGVLAARAPVIATLDGDGQNPPDNLPRLLAPLLETPASASLGLVAGQRVGRKDTLSKRFASRFANGLRRSLLKDGTRDTGCGLKAFRREAYLGLPYFNHQHRFLPALFARDGWDIAHVDVTHAPRGEGRSNYTNLGRALVGIPDLLGVWWLIRRAKAVTAVEPLQEEAGRK